MLGYSRPRVIAIYRDFISRRKVSLKIVSFSHEIGIRASPKNKNSWFGFLDGMGEKLGKNFFEIKYIVF